MKQLDYKSILERANLLYAVEKTKHLPASTIRYWAPEQFPKIQSNQVKCILQALTQATNQEL